MGVCRVTRLWQFTKVVWFRDRRRALSLATGAGRPERAAMQVERPPRLLEDYHILIPFPSSQ